MKINSQISIYHKYYCNSDVIQTLAIQHAEIWTLQVRNDWRVKTDGLWDPELRW